MNACYMTHVDPSDTVAISAPSESSRTGCLKVNGRDGDFYLFPPNVAADACAFLTALIDRAIELREEITARAELAAA
jgi:hypothetical protein